MLLTAKGHDTTEKLREAGVPKTAVWVCPERFMQPGVELLRDKNHSPRMLS